MPIAWKTRRKFSVAITKIKQKKKRARKLASGGIRFKLSYQNFHQGLDCSGACCGACCGACVGATKGVP